ncbi:hypothetical protein BDW75DRAFT_233898 [Aspergillus navahoensis]
MSLSGLLPCGFKYCADCHQKHPLRVYTKPVSSHESTSADLHPHSMLQEPSARTIDATASDLGGGRAAATRLDQFAKNVSVNNSGRAVAAAPVVAEKTRETVKQLHNELDEGAGMDTETITDSYQYSRPGHMNEPDEVRDYGDIPERHPLSLSSLDGLAVGEGGMILDNDGQAVGKVVEGDPNDLVGLIVNGYGEILDEDGDLIGCVDVLSEDVTSDRSEDNRAQGNDLGGGTPEREEVSPRVDAREEEYASSKIMTETRESPREESKVETQISSTEAIEEQGQAGQDERQLPDISVLEGLTCNTLGEIITPEGITVGELVDGDAMRICIDELCLDNQGQFKDGRGVVIGRARPIPSSQTQVRSGTGVMKEVAPEPIPENEEPGDPSAGFRVLDDLTVDKDGVVYDSSGWTVGRLADRVRDEDHDGLASRPVDTDLKANADGTTGTGELTLPQGDEKTRWFRLDVEGKDTDQETEPESEPHAKHARFDMQNLACGIANNSGYVIGNGHLVKEMCTIVQQTTDSMDPLCRQITLVIEEANLKPKNQLAAERLVEDLRPLITSAGDILQDCNNNLRSLSSDRQIASTLNSHGSLYSTPDDMTSEFQLANLLKDLAQTVIDTITTGRHRLTEISKEMPYARRKINPLWTLLSNRLFDVITAVGLLHSGVIGLFSRLLKGPWLGRAIRRLLVGIGLDRILDRLGIERVLAALLDGEAWVYRVLDGAGAGIGDLLTALLDLFGIHRVLKSMRVGMVSEALELEK